TPFTPTTINTYGFLSLGISNSVASPDFVSDNKAEISSRRILFNSSVPKYLSRATRSSIRLIIFKVVFTPTSDDIKTSSRSSNTSSSTFDFPATALDSLSKKDVFDFSNPLSSVSFFSDENKRLKKLIYYNFKKQIY